MYALGWGSSRLLAISLRYLGDDLSICSQMFNEFNRALVGLTRAITELSG